MCLTGQPAGLYLVAYASLESKTLSSDLVYIQETGEEWWLHPHRMVRYYESGMLRRAERLPISAGNAHVLFKQIERGAFDTHEES